MDSRAFIIVLGLLLTSGCIHPRKAKCPPINHAVAPFDQFVAGNFNWASVQRVVLMPLANETPYPRVSYELQRNIAAELQRAGRFEVVTATRDDHGARAEDVFASGQFNEIELLRVARQYQADAVLFVNVTNYHPYARPRLGLSLLLVSPTEGIAIASINGLWDTRETGTSLQAQAYFRQTQAWPRSLLGTERVFESPDVFQRFVCQQVAVSLYPAAPNVIGGAPMMTPIENVMPVDASMPAEASTAADPSMPSGTNLPPIPPASMETPP